MKKRILFAAIALGAAACSGDAPTASHPSAADAAPRNSGGYIGSGHRSDNDTTTVTGDGGYIGSGHRSENDTTAVDGGYIGTGN